MISLTTKFEVRSVTHYGDVKCVVKCKKWGGTCIGQLACQRAVHEAHADFFFFPHSVGTRRDLHLIDTKYQLLPINRATQGLFITRTLSA